MKIREPAIWATILDANPLPASCSANPADWGAWWLLAAPGAKEALHGAIVVIAAEQWADMMELALDGGAPVAALAPIALATLRYVNKELGPFALTDFQVGCALTMIEQVWLHGPALRAALEVQLLEQLVMSGAGS
jgi:hypothetical protein